MPSALLSLFAEVPDPRRGQGKMYDLPSILLFTVLAMLAGATSYRQVHGFIHGHLDRLNAAFGLGLRQAPAYTTLRFILRGLDGAALERVFRRHAAALVPGATDAEETPVCVAIDGKTLRGSFDAFHDRKAAHLLSAFASDGQIILGHLAIENKSNEIPAAQEMIATLGLSGCLFTLDAMHTKKTFAAVLATGNHMLVQLKGNQPLLSDVVDAIVSRNAPADTATSRTEARARQEDRTVEIFPVGAHLTRTEWAPFIKTIVRVTRHTWLRNAATGLWDQRYQVTFYVSSAEGFRASTWADVVRGHWGIENRNHYPLISQLACYAYAALRVRREDTATARHSA